MSKDFTVVERTSHFDMWFHNKWRPFIGWSYGFVCLFDFFIGPVLFNTAQFFLLVDISALTKWEPLTLQSNGLYHFSMMAIVGVTSFNRTQEKIQGNIREILKPQEPETKE